jgi:hypothetical protein
MINQELVRTPKPDDLSVKEIRRIDMKDSTDSSLDNEQPINTARDDKNSDQMSDSTSETYPPDCEVEIEDTGALCL